MTCGTICRMAELIGASVLYQDFRRQLMVFDRIAFGDLKTWLEIDSGRPRYKDVAADVRLLIERGLVFEPATDRFASGYSAEDSHAEYQELERRWPFERREELLKTPTSPETLELLAVLKDSLSRHFAAALRKDEKLNAVPIVSGVALPSDSVATRAEVLQLVIHSLPSPHASHTVADMLDFRDEARALGLTQGLRVWMNEMASGKLTGAEVSDKLDHLLSQYERALDLEKMSRETTILETFIFPAAGVVEYLTKLGSKLFTVRRVEIDLMKAEARLPGREVAYIAKARDRFGQ